MMDMSREKIIDREKLGGVLERLKRVGKKTVFTNGCFDIIHVGHIRYLEEAKKLGDILVIGLNSDRSVSAIKVGRPVTPQDQRAEVLSSLSMVDFVILFDEDTPYELIKALRPDILVKGADWKPEEIVGNDIVKDVRTIPLVEGISTSGIIKKIQEGVQ
jgi:D-beta-D-heptose 7-phosphate kinase/D-beta-D-heptose 1-phosphate adenosyltransferase